MEKKDGIVYVKRSQRDYSLSFKLGVVGEVERGELSLTDAARKYGIQGNNTIQRWLQKFGTFDQDNVISNCMVKSPQQQQGQEITVLCRLFRVNRQQYYRSFCGSLFAATLRKRIFSEYKDLCIFASKGVTL